MRLKKVTLRDETLLHQVVLFIPHHNGEIHISCNCLETKLHGHESMGQTRTVEESRELYNNPDNHKLPFGKDDLARW